MYKVLETWLELFDKQLPKNPMPNGINLDLVPKDFKELLLPFFYGKTFLSEKDLRYLESSINIFKLKSFYDLYQNLYLNEKLNILPVVSLWSETEDVEFTVIGDKNRLYLKFLSIPIEKVNDSIYIESLNRNYIRDIRLIDSLKIKMFRNKSSLSSNNCLRVLFKEQLSEKFNKFFNNRGIYCGQYTIGKEAILLQIKDSNFIWKDGSEIYKLNRNSLKDITMVLTDSDLLLNKVSLLDLKESIFKDRGNIKKPLS